MLVAYLTLKDEFVALLDAFAVVSHRVFTARSGPQGAAVLDAHLHKTAAAKHNATWRFQRGSDRGTLTRSS